MGFLTMGLEGPVVRNEKGVVNLLLSLSLELFESVQSCEQNLTLIKMKFEYASSGQLLTRELM